MAHHRRGLRRHLKDDVLAQAIEDDHRKAPVDARRRALLDYVEKLTLAPASVERDDVEQLRQTGFADVDILAIVQVAGYYAYVNRVADGLGVTLEKGF